MSSLIAKKRKAFHDELRSQHLQSIFASIRQSMLISPLRRSIEDIEQLMEDVPRSLAQINK